MNRTIVCLAALVVIAATPANAWKRVGDMNEIILGPKSTAKDIQAALDSLPDSGGTVSLQPGVYVLDRPLCMNKDNQTLRGAGPTTVLRLADKANCPLLIMGTLDNTPSRTVQNLRVSDLDLDGNRTNQQVECWQTEGEGSDIRNNGLTVRGVTDALVERVRCYRARSGGLVTEKGVRRLTVADYSGWDNQFDGLAAYVTEDSLFTRLILHDNPGAGLSLDHNFRHNVIGDSVMTSNGTGIFMRDSRDNLFQGLVIRDSREHGVFMSQTAVTNAVGDWIPTPDTECTGNVFSGLLITDSAAAGFLVNNDTCKDNVIQGARFARNALGGLLQSKPGLIKTQAVLDQ
jgi:hypothetical protein